MRIIILCLVVILGFVSVMAKLRPEDRLKAEEKIRPIVETQDLQADDLQLNFSDDMKNLFKNVTICIGKPICIDNN